MKKIEIVLSDSLLGRIEKISDLLDIDINKIINLCLTDGGYSRFWFPIAKLIDDIPDLLDDENETDKIYEIKQDLAKQFHERYEILKDIDSLERQFNKKFKQFSSDLEQHRAYLDFIDMVHTQTFIEQIVIDEEEVKEIPAPEEQVITEEVPHKFREELAEPQKEQSALQFKLFPKKYIPMLILIAISNFLVIKLVQLFWSHFNIFDILAYYPINLIPYILVICFISLIIGVLYRHFYNKYQESIPFRIDTREYKTYVKEFKKQNPRTFSRDPIIQIQSDIKRLQKFGEFMVSKTKNQ